MSAQQLEKVITLIDDANNQDPNIVSLSELSSPKSDYIRNV